MLSRTDASLRASERVAVKDDRLVYRACSTAFAESFGVESPESIVGRTDFELLPHAVAREQMVLDSRAMFTAQADIGTIELGRGGRAAPGRVMIVRMPLATARGKVRGIDVRLLGGQIGRPAHAVARTGAPVAALPAPVTIDYRTLVNDNIQGSLIFAADKVLFANDNAARVLGYANARALMGEGRLTDLIDAAELERVVATLDRGDDERGREPSVSESDGDEDGVSGRLTLSARTRDDRVLRLIARGTSVQWGVSRATLLSFVDVALLHDIVLGRVASPQAAPATVGRVAQRVTVPMARAHARTEARHEARSVARSPTASPTPVPAGYEGVPDETRLERLAASVRKLRESEQRFRHYARSAADFFWELDERLRFRALSGDVERVLGLPEEHLLGRSLRQLAAHPANVTEPARWREHLDTLDARGPFRDFEFRWCVDGDTRVIRSSGLPMFDDERRFVGYRGVGCDVTAAVRQAETTAYHANHDALTALVNRRHFEGRVSAALEGSRERREAHALCFMDLDSFKVVNDTCGHRAGDELLRQLARLFDSLIRTSDVLARIGGDEFGVLLYKCDVPGALKLANQIRAEVESFQFLWEGKRFSIGVSVGLVVVDDRWEGVEPLFNAADSACYIAKNEGRNRVVVHREGEGNASNRKIATHWVEEIGAALASDRLELARQRIVPLQGEPDGERFEMLLRLRLANGDVVSPRAFLPAAERHGLASALDERAIELTLGWLGADRGVAPDLRHVSLNLASSSFTDEAFASRLLKRIDESGVPAGMLCFEMAETATIANLARASEFMHRLAAVGCRFSIDDFGSGLSSFAWLRDLPIDFLKIDGALVRDVIDDPIDFTTVRAIGEISRSMGKCTIAQSVESPALLEAVRGIGLDFAQGFDIGEPQLLPH